MAGKEKGVRGKKKGKEKGVRNRYGHLLAATLIINTQLFQRIKDTPLIVVELLNCVTVFVLWGAKRGTT